MKFIILIAVSTLIFMASMIYIIIANFHPSATHLETALIAFVVSGILMMGLVLAYVIRLIKDK